jgi:peptide deformylase
VPLHSDFITHIKHEEDKDILKRKLFDVNMRLFKTSSPYKRIVEDIIDYLFWALITKKDGYKMPDGMSGANLGIPFNIIGYRIADEPIIMLNPKITRCYGYKIQVKSNCGSLTLDEPIAIERYEYIDIEYYDIDGNLKQVTGIDRKSGGFTIQHEIDHNLGVLITDRSIA